MMTGARDFLEQKRELDEKSTPNLSISSTGLFKVNVPTLFEIAATQLLSQEHKLRDIVSIPDEYIDFKQKKLKHMLEAILQGDPDTVQKMSEQYPSLLL